MLLLITEVDEWIIADEGCLKLNNLIDKFIREKAETQNGHWCQLKVLYQ